MKSFEELDIYKRSVHHRVSVYKLTRSFPSDEKYKLTDQIIRSTRKCPANISEGHGRYHYQENIQYCRIARGSLTETQDHLNVAEECGYIDLSTRDKLKNEISRTIQMINGYIRYLNNQKKGNS